MQTDATLLASNFQHYWMLHVASVCTPCCMLLLVVGSCCAKFETGQTFEPTTPNMSFVPWSSKCGATMLDPGLHSSFNIVGPMHTHYINYGLQSLMGWILPTMHCTPNIVGKCCICLHTTANTDATTPNIVGPTMLGVMCPLACSLT